MIIVRPLSLGGLVSAAELRDVKKRFADFEVIHARLAIFDEQTGLRHAA